MYSSEYHRIFWELFKVNENPRRISNEIIFRRDKLWIAMELCAGGSMQDIYHSMREKNCHHCLLFFHLVYGPLSELQISYILRETLKGLDYLHKNGKMHRDVKVRNDLFIETH